MANGPEYPKELPRILEKGEGDSGDRKLLPEVLADKRPELNPLFDQRPSEQGIFIDPLTGRTYRAPQGMRYTGAFVSLGGGEFSPELVIDPDQKAELARNENFIIKDTSDLMKSSEKNSIHLEKRPLYNEGLRQPYDGERAYHRFGEAVRGAADESRRFDRNDDKLPKPQKPLGSRTLDDDMSPKSLRPLESWTIEELRAAVTGATARRLEDELALLRFMGLSTEPIWDRVAGVEEKGEGPVIQTSGEAFHDPHRTAPGLADILRMYDGGHNKWEKGKKDPQNK